MTDTTTQTPQTQGSTGAEMDAVDEQLAAHLVEQARSEGISLVGPDGLLQRLTKLVLEGALEGEPARPSGLRAWRPGRPQRRQLPQRHPRQDGADRGRSGRP